MRHDGGTGTHRQTCIALHEICIFEATAIISAQRMSDRTHKTRLSVTAETTPRYNQNAYRTAKSALRK